MKVFNPLTVAVGVAFVGGVSAKATQSQTKDLTLDTNIVPTWSQLGTNPNSYKIKLGRVTAYWKEAEERDVSAARSLYSKSSDKNSAEDKVQAFYDGAEKCLGKQSTTDRKLESDINTALGQIKECIKNVKTPVFNVASTVNFPKGYPSSVTVDYSDATKTDEDADLKEYSKSISLDTSLPTWDDLGTNADSYKIKLERLKSYWAAAETRDKKAADSFYAADKNEDAAVNKVKDFYDDAEDCMKKQAETTRKTRSEIDQGLKEIKDCISKKASPLTFTVVKTVKLPSNYDSPLVVDYSKAIKEDEEDDLYEAPKDISLDSDIVPTWDDLGTSANTYKIKLARVSSYWKETEERDISAARSFYSKTADKNAAEDKVEAFYNGAEKCLNKQSTTERKTQSEINTALGQIKNCITKSVTPPVFTVVRITTLPSNYNKPVTVDYSSAIKDDEDADLKEYGKQISLDTALPTWDDLGTNADSYKIKLERLKSYWAVAETRDKKAVAPFYVAEKNDDAAVKKVKDFYDDAEDCMKKQAETTRKTRSEIDQGLQEIKDCITKIATPLTFTVLKTVNLPTNYDAPLVLDFSKAIASDEEADLKEATPAPTPAPPMKQISLDYDIVPTWSQLGTNSKTKKIRLYRIYSYWDKTEARDKKAVKNFYSTTKEDNAAAEKIDDFYDGAKACLAKQKVLERKTRTQVETALQEIKDCIIKSVVPPVFTVLTTVNIPEDYFSLVDNDEEEGYADTNKEDQQEDAAEDAVDKQTTPEITTAPLVTPVATTASPAQLAAPIIEVTPAPYSAPVDNDASSATTQVSPLISPTTTTAPETVPVPIDDKVDYPEQPQQITEPPPETYTGDFTPPEEKDDGYFMPGVPAPEEELPSTDEGTTDVIPPSQGETDDEPPRHYETPQEPTGDVYPPEDTDTGGVTPGVPAPQEEEPSTSEGTETDTGDFYPPTETDNGFVPGVPAPQEEEPSTSEGTETDTGDITPGVPSPEEPTDVTPPIVDPLDIVVDPAAYPVSLPDIPDSEALEWPFSPASPDVPPLWALDLDKSESVDTSEWQQYIEHLHTMARDAAVQGSDPVAVALLKQIVDFHYGSFAQCITSKLKADGISTLTESEYEPVAQWIEKNCYVKFRYSLLAGAPPFEWIAKEKPIVSAQEIEVWFTKRVNTARKDITRLPNVSAAQQEMVERFIGCAYASLNAAGAAPIYRDAFYAVLTHIEQCASA